MARARKSKRVQEKLAQGNGSDLARIALRLCALGLALAMAVLGAVYLHYHAYIGEPVLEAGETKTLVIPRSTAWPRVVDILERDRLVTRPAYFEYWARRRHLPAAVKAGTFELVGPLSLEELAAKLREGGRFDETTVTFPEGLSIFHLADLVEKLGLVDRSAFLRAARDEEALAEAGLEAESFEGYLFPDTYRFRKGTSAAEIVAKLHARWRVMWAALSEKHADSMARVAEKFDFDVKDFVTLASIVQRETSLASESPVIARVFYNRLERDMRLQTDPTCVYGPETYDEVPTPEHCKDPLNRYSTYVIDGLPPGPISNPGEASLEAVLDPSANPEAKEYLFFVARRDGSRGHYFSETYAEHKRAIRRYLR
jgi:UPF0755 protein